MAMSSIRTRPGRPVEYYDGRWDKGFRVTKVSPPDEHYFALGDKTGPLDRRNMAFSMWNTDAFGFQESTDPIYKSIPFVLTMNEGRAAGLFLDNTWRTSWEFNKDQRDAWSFTAPEWAAGLLHPLRSGPEAGAERVGVAGGAFAAAAEVVAGLPAVALQLLSGVGGAQHCEAPARGPYSGRRDLAGHRLPAGQPAVHGRLASAFRTSSRW